MSLSLLQLGADQILKNVLCTPNNSRSEKTIDIDAEREHDVLLVAWVLTSSRYVILQPNIDAVKVKKNTVHQLIDDHHIIGGLNVKYRNL